jgi:flagellar biosynthesis/type III secretory pathway chaperone
MSGPQRDSVQPHLQRVLQEEARLLTELEGLLQQETVVLNGNDVAAIQTVGNARQRCVERLTQLDAERLDAARLLSFGTGPAALERLLTWADPTGSLQREWLANLQVARRCKQLNDRNGAIVTVKLGQVQQMLSKLRGTPAAPVYGPRAGRYGALPARALGRA